MQSITTRLQGLSGYGSQRTVKVGSQDFVFFGFSPNVIVLTCFVDSTEISYLVPYICFD